MLPSKNHGVYRHEITLKFKLIETTIFKIITDDDVGDGVKNESDIVGIGGAGEVTVHFLETIYWIN